MIAVIKINPTRLGRAIPMPRGRWRFTLINAENASRAGSFYQPVRTLNDHSPIFVAGKKSDLDAYLDSETDPTLVRPQLAFGIAVNSTEPPIPADRYGGLLGRLVKLESTLKVVLPILDLPTVFGFRIKEMWFRPQAGGVDTFALVHAHEPVLIYEGTRTGFTFPLELGWDPRVPGLYSGDDVTVFSNIVAFTGGTNVPLAGEILPRNPEKITYLPMPAGCENANLWCGNWGLANAA